MLKKQGDLEKEKKKGVVGVRQVLSVKDKEELEQLSHKQAYCPVCKTPVNMEKDPCYYVTIDKEESQVESINIPLLILVCPKPGCHTTFMDELHYRIMQLKNSDTLT